MFNRSWAVVATIVGCRHGRRGLSSHIFVGSRGGCGGLSRWLRWALAV